MRNKFNQLNGEIWRLPNGQQKLALLEEAIRIADLYLTKQDAYQARMTYSEAALMSGYAERFLVSFAWCLSQFEKNPGNRSSYMIVWHYKWAVNQLWRFPQVPLEQIKAVNEDFKSICLKHGYSLRPYYQHLHIAEMAAGNGESAAIHYKNWKNEKRDGMSDCKACEQNAFGVYHFQLGHHKKGLQVIKPILDGHLSCAEIPHNTYGNVLLPLLELGRREEAEQIAKKGIKLIKGAEFITEWGRFLEYYAITDLQKAFKLFERTVMQGLESKVLWDRFNYLVSVRVFLEQWFKRKRRKKFDVPEYVTLEWITNETNEQADAFDKRNGNDAAKRYIANKSAQIGQLSRTKE